MSKHAPILDAKLNYLFSRVGGKSIKLGLNVTESLLRHMEADVLRLPCVHVAGTNGKGSVSVMIESVLREAGLLTALYTSPHLIRFNERIRVGGETIQDDELLRLLDVAEAADQANMAERGGRAGTFFELTTAVALKWFVERGVQVAVLETGMGGRLDSTNVVVPLVSVITDIGVEHGAFLGRTLPEIAREKAGVIKAGRPVVVGRQQHPEVMAVLEERAREVGAPVIRADEGVSVQRKSVDLDGQVLLVETADGTWPPFVLPLLGDFQLGNAALAIAALEWMREALGLAVSPEVIRAGLGKARWPARCQVVRREPLFIVDVAHNPDAAKALAGFIRHIRGERPVALICGLLSDKDAAGFFRLLKPVVDACVLVPLDSERSMPMEEMLAAAKKAKLPAAESRVSEAVPYALNWAQSKNGMVVSAGSFLLASAVLYELGAEI